MTRAIKISRDATFDEHHRLADVPKETSAHVRPPNNDSIVFEPNQHTIYLVEPTSAELLVKRVDDSTTIKEKQPSSSPEEIDSSKDVTNPLDQREPEDDQHMPSRRSLRGRIPRREWKAWSAMFGYSAPYEPSSYKDAMNCPE